MGRRSNARGSNTDARPASQSTDKKVNELSPALYALAPDAHAMAALDPTTVEALIRTLGLARTKSRNLVAASQLLVDRHGGSVPSTFADLEALPGVGHKTASCVLAQCHGCASLMYTRRRPVSSRSATGARPWCTSPRVLALVYPLVCTGACVPALLYRPLCTGPCVPALVCGRLCTGPCVPAHAVLAS